MGIEHSTQWRCHPHSPFFINEFSLNHLVIGGILLKTNKHNEKNHALSERPQKDKRAFEIDRETGTITFTDVERVKISPSGSYAIEIDPETGEVTITFGDGEQGKRLPSGSNNIVTVYRNPNDIAKTGGRKLKKKESKREQRLPKNSHNGAGDGN
jgi:hypothetical protein